MKKIHFTLIELLLVTAVIIVLAGMLMPAIQKARETGMKTSCLNQQKQLWLINFAYTDDMKTSFIYVYSPSSWNNNLYDSGYVKDLDFTRCPKGKKYPTSEGYSAVYTYNYDIYAFHLYRGHISRVKNPSCVALFADAVGRWRQIGVNTSDRMSVELYSWHLNKVNIIYLDGHAGSSKLPEAIQNTDAWNYKKW